jgi:hypothetical protein
VSVGGLLILGVLLWFFVFRRRSSKKNNAHHSMMPSYDSDSGVHAMMPDKEIPVALARSSSSPRSAYVGSGGEGRPSADHPYTPYSDRAPDHQHHQRHLPTTGPAAATSQTDISIVSTATGTGATTRYAHLVEEGMTEQEIRQLEYEERQLDAAIEHAGRRETP